jgi:hypothetical protein
MGKLIIQVSDLKSLIKERYLVRPHNKHYSRRAVAYAYNARQRGLTPEQMMASASQMNNNPFSGDSSPDFRRGTDLNIELGRLEADKRRLEIDAFKRRSDPVEQQNIKNRMDMINKRLDDNYMTLSQLGSFSIPKQGNSVSMDYENDGSFIGDNNSATSSNMFINPYTRFYKQGGSEPSVVGDIIPPPVEAVEPVDFNYEAAYRPTKPFELTNPMKKRINPMKIIKQVPDEIPPPVANAIYEYEDPFLGYIPEAERIGARRTKYQMREAEMMGAEDKPVIKKPRGRPRKYTFSKV